MQAALWISKTGMAAQDAKMTAISNNLANINTVGFKRDRVIFEDLFYSIQTQAGSPVDGDNNLPTGVQLGNGVRVVGTQKVHTQGGVQNTHQELDLAIVGSGFFQVENSDGEIMFSRNGQFNINEDGQVVNTAGLPLVPEMTIPEGATSISIDIEGGVSVTMAGQVNMDRIGEITLATFMNPSGLSANGGNLYRETEASGAPNEVTAGIDGAGIIKQGALEGSNVQVVTEMVDMIATQRAYEMSAKMVSAADEMLQYIAQAT
ncbi:flagellar basal-body rod protein FlgG [Psychromonas sp. Urea-02u-13]|uniref:flagellar basal-body rod protein FlgG n=1 Tax=Psychromonas sp. Urea-02u-13 TaxID=2058326 RepID=UPI000C33D77B|nr:flagellar basal-body rod protein FlgG [Psychromonas sp. Urea-02u-13]PKG39532.1 flagellar basal-body rod protein FlgG [Psychromonas sp. Urea-02u-13]